MNVGKEVSRCCFLEVTSALGGVVACDNPAALFALNKRGLTEEQMRIEERPSLAGR
jgi:hypothetical protein